MSRKKHKKRRDYSNKISKRQRAVGTLIILFSAVLCLALPYIYSLLQGQYLILTKPDRIFFVTKSMLIATYPFAFLFFIILAICCTWFRYEKLNFEKNWRAYRIIIIVLIFLLITPFAFINNRYDICQDGIYKYSIFGQIQKKYSWSDISDAKVYISYTSTGKVGGGYVFFYDIKLNDGKYLKLYQDGHSRDRVNGLYVVDDVLQHNNVTINRDSNNLDKLNKAYKDSVEGLFK